MKSFQRVDGGKLKGQEGLFNNEPKETPNCFLRSEIGSGDNLGKIESDIEGND